MNDSHHVQADVICDRTEGRKTLVVSDLASAFRRVDTPRGQMHRERLTRGRPHLCAQVEGRGHLGD
jgi:hypothetical protein